MVITVINQVKTGHLGIKYKLNQDFNFIDKIKHLKKAVI